MSPACSPHPQGSQWGRGSTGQGMHTQPVAVFLGRVGVEVIIRVTLKIPGHL